MSTLDPTGLRSTTTWNHLNPASREADRRRAFRSPRPAAGSQYDLSCRTTSITFAQWLLAFASVAVAVAGLLSESPTTAVTVALIVSTLSLLLTGLAIYNTLRSGLIGQTAMLGALWIMFFMEAVQSALGDPPFSAPQYFHFGAAQFDVPTVCRSLLHICLFQLMLLVGFSIPSGRYRLDRWLSSRVDRVRGRLLLEGLLAALILLSLASTYLWDWGHLFRSMLGSYRARFGEDVALSAEPPLLSYLFPVGLYGTAVLFVEALQTRGLRRYAAGVLAAVATLIVILSGSRHTVLVILLPVAAVILKRSYGQLRLSKVLLWASAILLLFGVFQIQVASRNVGWDEAWSVLPKQMLNVDMTGQFPALLVSESLVPTHHDYFLEPTPVYFLTHWIPRRLWPEKPVEKVSKYFNDVVTGGDPVWNVAPSVVGQFYMNAGVVGLLSIGCVLGIICRTTDIIFARLTMEAHQAALTWIATLYVFVINSFRLVAPFYLVYVVMALLGMFVLTNRVATRRQQRRAPVFST